jgi:hypothetical protein
LLLATEQAYICLAEVCHFLAASDMHLKHLSESELAQKTAKLVIHSD